MIDELGFGFLFAPDHHPAMRHAGPGAALARRAHGLQPARPADQPGRRAPPADRRLRAGAGSSRWRRRCARSAASTAWSCTAPPGIDELSPCGATTVATVRGGGVTLSELDARDLGIELCALVRPGAAASRSATPRSRSRCSAASEGPQPTRPCSTRPPRSWWRGARPISARAWQQAREALRSGAAMATLSALRAAGKESGMSYLRRHRGLDARAARGAPRDALAGRRAAATRGAASVIAEVKRASPVAGRRSRPAPIPPRSRRRYERGRRRRDLRAHLGARLRRLATPTSPPCARSSTCRSCARTSSSTSGRSPRRACTAPTPSSCCSRWSRTASRPTSSRPRRISRWRRSSRCTAAPSWSARSTSERRSSASTRAT